MKKKKKLLRRIGKYHAKRGIWSNQITFITICTSRICRGKRALFFFSVLLLCIIQLERTVSLNMVGFKWRWGNCRQWFVTVATEFSYKSAKVRGCTYTRNFSFRIYTVGSSPTVDMLSCCLIYCTSWDSYYMYFYYTFAPFNWTQTRKWN